MFARHDIRATFFMCVGPDNMGRHLWRLLKPAFLVKMLRSNAASLYGWDILLRGLLWPGPIIGERLQSIIKLPYIAGHEVGLHAWDHHLWQMSIEKFSAEQLHQQIKLGFDKLREIIGARPLCSAAAGWRCNERALLAKEAFGFKFNSDCRGTHIFSPKIGNATLTPQIPVTLPTYDEVVGQAGITTANYNNFLLPQFKPNQLNVYTIHAETEGIALHKQFDELLRLANDNGIRFCPLGELLEQSSALPKYSIVEKAMAGREGWLAAQGYKLA
jgi:undecaprenyl phosphate-alpha-L-ara4FN deformylase